MSIEEFMNQQNYFYAVKESTFRNFGSFIIPSSNNINSTNLIFYCGITRGYITKECSQTLVTYPTCEYIFKYQNNQITSLRFNLYPKGKKIIENLEVILVSNKEEQFLKKLRQINKKTSLF